MTASSAFNVKSWLAVLQQATPQDNTSPHKYICNVRTNGGAREILALSQAEMDAYKVPFWKIWVPNPCQKLSFGEICRITIMGTHTRSLFGRSFVMTSERIIFSDIENFLQLQLKPEDPESEQKIKRFLSKIAAVSSLSQGSLECLTKMTERSTFHHQQKRNGNIWRISDIWRKINYYIWSWFYDKSVSIKQLSQNPITPVSIKTQFVDQLSFRIFVNLNSIKDTKESSSTRKLVQPLKPGEPKPKWYYAQEEEPSTKPLQAFNCPENEKGITSPNKVKKILVPCHVDKCGQAFFEKIKEPYIKVMLLNKVWEGVEDLFANIFSDGNSNVTSSHSQPLAIEGS